MSPEFIGLVAIIALLALLATGIPIAAALGLVGVLGSGPIDLGVAI